MRECQPVYSKGGCDRLVTCDAGWMCSKRPRGAMPASMVEGLHLKAGHHSLPLVAYGCGMRKHSRKQFLPQRSPAFWQARPQRSCAELLWLECQAVNACDPAHERPQGNARFFVLQQGLHRCQENWRLLNTVFGRQSRPALVPPLRLCFLIHNACTICLVVFVHFLTDKDLSTLPNWQQQLLAG